MDLATFSTYVAIYSELLVAVPVVFGFFYYKKLDKVLKIFHTYLVLSLIISVISIILAFSHIHNHFLGHYETTLKILLLSRFIILNLPSKKASVYYAFFVTTALLLLGMELILYSKIDEINSYTNKIILFVVLISCTFIMNHKIKSFDDSPNFFIFIGLSVYGFVEFIFSIFEEKLLNSDATYRIYFQCANIVYFFLILSFGIYSYAFYKVKS